jgi:hypothetical protein
MTTVWTHFAKSRVEKIHSNCNVSRSSGFSPL